MSVSSLTRGTVLALCLACLFTAGCSSNRNRILQRSGPEVLYKRGHQRLQAYDFNSAIKIYEALTARFPFTEQARQARLDLIYAYYRAGETDSAVDAANTFIRENPTHPRVDYALYIKGLVNFPRTPNFVDRLFRVDLSRRPPSTARKSFDAFKRLVERHPHSPYAPDARQRMIYLRNRLARYDVSVARFYIKRGAYVAAARRARNTIQEYDGAPAVREALQVMILAYDRLGLTVLANQARKVYTTNFPGKAPAQQAAERSRHWWKFW